MAPQNHPHSGPPEPEMPAGPWTGGIDARRLLVLHTVGREGSFAAAARALGWTQPAVSQHIHRLERDIGMPLVSRVGRGIALTDPGRMLLPHADAVASALRGADRVVADLAGLRRGRVRIAAFPSASATLVARAIGSLASQHPEMDVHLTQLEPPEAEALLLVGECDIALVFAYAEESDGPDASLRRSPLLDDPLRLVLPPGHPRAADREPIPLEELRAERWVAGCPRCRRHLVASAHAAGFEPDIRHSTDDYVVVQTLVATGTAVAVLPHLALAASRHPAVRVAGLADHPPRQVVALTSPGSAGVPAVAAALAHLRRAAAALAEVAVAP